MTTFQDAVDATSAAFGIEAVYTPAGGEPVSVRLIARRPDTIVGFGETRVYAETATFEVQASEGAVIRSKRGRFCMALAIVSAAAFGYPLNAHMGRSGITLGLLEDVP